MPDLNLREIQYRLEIQKKILLERLQNQEETAESDEGIDPDQSDLAGRYRRQNPDTQWPVRARQQLAEVERALERLMDGSYGKCSLCEQSIQSEHLELIPAATLCIQCQEQKNNNKMRSYTCRMEFFAMILAIGLYTAGMVLGKSNK